MKKFIVITDLDGTLLDTSTYSFEAAKEALNHLIKQNIPLIICSSKTRAEIEYYRRLLNNHDPFISENGGGIFIPQASEDLTQSIRGEYHEVKGEYFVIPLGTDYSELRRGIIELRKAGFNIRGFGDMSIEEISDLTGLSLEEASMAKERDFDEPFIFPCSGNNLQNLLTSIHTLGFQTTQGRVHHLLGNSDKGKAVSLLLNYYKQKYHQVHSIGLGDSPNDLSMLEEVDTPIIVRKPDGTYDAALDIPGITRADGIGPEGWNRAVLQLISQTDNS